MGTMWLPCNPDDDKKGGFGMVVLCSIEAWNFEDLVVRKMSSMST